jgi:hypothetical protein
LSLHGILGNGLLQTGVLPAWWTCNGLYTKTQCVGAWQAKGAASYAASLLDLTGNGNNLVDPGGAATPTWNAATGWTFDGIANYLRTVIVPSGNQTWSSLLQYTNFGGAGPRGLFSLYDVSAGDVAFLVQKDAAMETYNGGAGASGVNVPVLVAGNYGFCGKTVYRNGVAEPGLINTDLGGITTKSPYIGAMHYWDGTTELAASFAPVEIIAVSAYNLDASANIAALAALMAAL